MRFMDKMKLDRNKSICLGAVILIVLAQAAEKILEVSITPSQTAGIVCALVYTVVVAVVYFLVSRSTSSLMGILAALLALKMLPPNITYLSGIAPDESMVYFIVQKMTQILFAVLIYKFYCAQEKPRQIRALPILLLILAVPFANEISAFFGQYFLYKTGSMILPFLTQYACYALAALVILVVSYKCGKDSMRFAAYFEFVAFGINIFRQIGKLGYYMISDQHISKSLYGWIILFAALIVIYAVALAKSKKVTE